MLSLSDRGDKLIRFAPWQGAKWYVRRRYPGAARKATIGAVGVVAVAGIAVGVAPARKGSQEES
jgi:hypothetical protein